MRKLIFLTVWLSAAALSSFAQTVVELPQASQRATTTQRVGLTDIAVNYSRPAVNGRKIWGEVVPYGFTLPTVDGKDKAPWKTGANMNTTLSFTHEVNVEGKPIAAGTYGFFVAVHEDSTATLVLSRTNHAYGQYFYKEDEDVLRAKVNTKTIAPTELFTFSFDEVKERYAVLSLKWETKEIPIKIDVNVQKIVTASLIEQLKQPATFTWHGRVQAARYLFDQQANLDLALQWTEEAIHGAPGQELLVGEKNFATLTTHYYVLYALNRIPEAKTSLNEALDNPGNISPARVVAFGRSLLTRNRKDDAQRVLTWALQKWPSSWETKQGMARLHSANGKYKDALKLEQDAYATAPEDQKPTLALYIKKLETNIDFN